MTVQEGGTWEMEQQDVARAVRQFGDTVYRICRLHLREEADREDVLQETFLRLIKHRKPFVDEVHLKAWLCRVAINGCRDVYRSPWRRRMLSLDAVELAVLDRTERDVIDAVLSLPTNLRNAIHLHYYEGYSVPEMSDILGRKENTLYSDLNRARKRLRTLLGGGLNEKDLSNGDGQDPRGRDTPVQDRGNG